MCTPVYVDLAVVCSVLIEMEGLAINQSFTQAISIEYRFFAILRSEWGICN
jgi:hypothetical protein